MSDVSTRPVLRVRSLDPKAVCHRPPTNFPPGLRPWGWGLNPSSSCLQTLIFEWKSALNFNPWAKFQTFRQLTPSSFRSIPTLAIRGGGIKWSRDRRRHVTLKGQTRDPNTLRVKVESRKQLEMLFSNNCELLGSLLWGSTVGYRSDSLASCCLL